MTEQRFLNTLTLFSLKQMRHHHHRPGEKKRGREEEGKGGVRGKEDRVGREKKRKENFDILGGERENCDFFVDGFQKKCHFSFSGWRFWV